MKKEIVTTTKFELSPDELNQAIADFINSKDENHKVTKNDVQININGELEVIGVVAFMNKKHKD